MNDDLEQRLKALATAKVPRLDDTRVDAIERQLLTESAPARRASWITAAAAACVLVALGVALAVRRDDPNTLQPSSSPATTATTATTAAPTSTTPPNTTAAPTSTVVPTTATPATTVAPTTSVPDTIPAASFALTVERVGNELRFAWPRYSGDGATRYLLIRVDADGLSTWPPTDARIAVTTADLDDNSATVTLRGTERRRWVVAVIGENRRLIAVSSVAIST
jgi:hypothetical protein